MKDQTISVVIIAYNEEDTIEECLRSASFADEIIVIDNESTDKTKVIAQKFTRHVFTAKRVGYVEPVRNFGITKATGNWILVLDADERVPESLAITLREIAFEDTCDAVQIPRKNIIFHKWIEHTGWWPDNLLRFFKKGSVTWPDEIHKQPVLPERVKTLDPYEKNAISHETYSSVSQYLQKLDAYTSIQAKELHTSGKAFHPSMVLRAPSAEFMSRFFAREGYRDGLHGLALSLLQAFSQLIVSLKVWELEGFVEKKDILPLVEAEKENLSKEGAYWMLTTRIANNKSPLQKILLKGKRKLRS